MADDLEQKLESLRGELAEIDLRREQVIWEINQYQKAISVNRSDNLVTDNIASAGVCNTSLSKEKIALFRSLFRGREDVYPRRFESIKTGKSGYQPACKNEWVSGLCAKPKIKCSACSFREYFPVTDEVIECHLRGLRPHEKGNKDFTIGVYPMMLDETCWFLAVDFDKSAWQEDVLAYVETCRKFDIPVSIERSRSGNGGHVWMFFDEPVACAKARAVADYILTETMKNRPELGLDSYDRFFPNQDTLPSGGFGNLIALPLQKKPRDKGNSVFVDENFRPYSDQWKYMSSIKRIGREQLDLLFNEARNNGRVVGLRIPVTQDDDDKPWENPPSGKQKNQITGPFPAEIEVVLANQVFIPKKDLSPSLRNALIRLAAFQNPEFYKKQAMRMPTYDTPRVICCAEDFSNHIALPRGCFDEVAELLEGLNISVAVKDEQYIGENIDVEFNGKLYPEQEAAAAELLKYDNGILAATTAFGKTVIAAYMLAKRGVNTLVLVHRRQLLEQWKSRLTQFLELDDKQIGQLGGGKRKLTGKIDIGIIQSLSKKGVVDDVVANYGHLIIDECHHISAPTFEAIARQFKGKYITGLSATVARKDGHHPIIYMNCGPVRYKVSAKAQAEKRAFNHRLIVRETSFKLPLNLQFKEKVMISELYAELTNNIPRNAKILEDVMDAIQDGRCPALLTERRDHLEFFREIFEERIDNLIVFKGGMGKKQLTVAQEKLEKLSQGEPGLILATGRYLGEGFDCPRLDTLFLALPVSWKGTIAQYAGRLHREHYSKSEVVIYDYVDTRVQMLAKMFTRRLQGYKAIGYEISDDVDRLPIK